MFICSTCRSNDKNQSIHCEKCQDVYCEYFSGDYELIIKEHEKLVEESKSFEGEMEKLKNRVIKNTEKQKILKEKVEEHKRVIKEKQYKDLVMSYNSAKGRNYDSPIIDNIDFVLWVSGKK